MAASQAFMVFLMASKRKAKTAPKKSSPKPKRKKPMANSPAYTRPAAAPVSKPAEKPKVDTSWRPTSANTPGEQIVEADTGGGQIVEAYKSGGLWRLKGSARGSTDTISVIRWRPKA